MPGGVGRALSAQVLGAGDVTGTGNQTKGEQIGRVARRLLAQLRVVLMQLGVSFIVFL